MFCNSSINKKLDLKKIIVNFLAVANVGEKSVKWKWLKINSLHSFTWIPRDILLCFFKYDVPMLTVTIMLNYKKKERVKWKQYYWSSSTLCLVFITYFFILSNYFGRFKSKFSITFYYSSKNVLKVDSGRDLLILVPKMAT